MLKLPRLSAFTFGIQLVWGAILAVSLQARATELAGAGGLAFYTMIAPIGATIATIVQVAAGYLSDAQRKRVGHRRDFLLYGTALSAVAIFWFYLAPSILQFALAFCLLQFALNVATGPYQAFIPDYVPPERRGAASSWMSGWQSFGNAVGLLVAGFVHQVRLVAAILVAALIAACAVTLTHVRSLNALSAETSRFALNRTFTMLLVSRGIVNMGFFTLLGFLFFFVQQSLGIAGHDAAQMQTALVFLTFTLAAIAGAFIVAGPTDRYDVRAVATAANAIIIVALAALAGAGSLAVAYGAAAVAGAAWGAFFTADWALACALLPRGAMATAMGVWNVATAGPQILAPLVAAPFVLHYNAVALGLGPRVAVVLSLVEFAVGTALLWTLPSTRAAAARGAS
jgi:MFS family permease